MLDDLNNQELHKKAEGALQKILNKNPEVDFTVLCNYIRQSQNLELEITKTGIANIFIYTRFCPSRKLYTNLNSMDFLHPVRQDSFFPIGIEHPEWG